MKIDFKLIKPVLEKHGPTILTGLASIGVLFTGYLVHRADLKNLGDIAEAVLFTDDSDIPMGETVKRVTKKNWKLYIPSAVSAVCTIGCIVGADRWHVSKEGMLAAAALMYKTSGEELEKKLREEFGDEKVTEIKQKIAEEKAEQNRPPWEERHPDKMKIWEPYTEQWFYASQKDILWAEIVINKKLAQEMEVTLNDLLALYGCKKTKKGEELGWTIEDECFTEIWACGGALMGNWIDFCPQVIENKDGTTYFQMEYVIHPVNIDEVYESHGCSR